MDRRGYVRQTLAELIEYALVVGLTISLSALGFAILGGSLPVLGQSQARAQMEEVDGAAGLAALKGNATLVLPLSQASLECSQGVLTLESGSSDLTTPVEYPCSFSYTGVSCLCTLVFTESEGVVQLRLKS